MAGIQNNRYYNDPALGQAFSNLSGLFGPPSASDTLAYASAKAKKEEASRLAEFFSYAKDPTYSRETADRLNYAINGNANNTYYNVDKDAETQRYGYDRTFDASRLNNADDNARALTTNRADNARAFANARYGALGANQVLPDLPQSVAELYGVPAAVGQTGIITLNPGEQATLPDGRVMSGAVKPLTEGEVKGAERQRLAQSGQLTDQMLLDTIIGAETPVQTVGADGKPVFKSPGTAVREGAQPFVNKGAEAKPVNYQAPDGARGTATVGGNGQLVDTQTGQPLPAGSVTFGTNIQGSEADTGMSTKTNQTRSVQLRGNVTNMNGLVTELEDLVVNNPAVTGMAGDILSFTQDAKQVINELGQKFGGDQNAPITIEEIKALTDRILPQTQQYNPVYRKAAALVFELAYANAKLNNPGGEVSRFALERELEQLGQGLVGNDKALMAVLDVSKGRMRRALDEADVLGGAKPGITADQIGRRGSGQPSAGQTTTRLKFDENGNSVQ